MADIILGLGTSHGPQLLTPPEHWHLRETADRENKALAYQGGSYDFATLASLRGGQGLIEKQSPAARQAHYDRCQVAIAAIAKIYGEAAPDVAVIFGNDQFEVFTRVNIPAFSVFWGDYVENIPKTAEQKAMIPAGAAFADAGYCPPERTRYPGCPELGEHLIKSLIGDDFDVAQSTELPVGRMGNNSVPHAYGYIYRQVMLDRVVPQVPVMINTHYPPNRPSARRCIDFGRSLARAIKAWPSSARVALIASGGLSHFVIDEALDREFLAAVQSGDIDRIAAIPESAYESGTAEIKNWLPLVGAMIETGLSMSLVDYVPCYRSEAGTGNAMAFASWS